MNLPVEAIEMECPIRINRTEVCLDSGGAGAKRGGLGLKREYEVLDGTVRLTHRGERFFSQAPGLAGGEPGAFAKSRIVRADGSEETIRSKIVCNMAAGDRLIVETPGGGGYGPKAERSRADIQADLDNHKISPEAVQAIYGLTPEKRQARR